MKEEDINLDLLYYNVDSFRQIVTGKFPERKYPENRFCNILSFLVDSGLISLEFLRFFEEFEK